MVINKNQGFTFIEVLASSIITVFVVMAIIMLLASVYRGIMTSKFKAYAISMAEQNIELLKNYSFSSLEVTPDDCLPEPLSNLHKANNPWAPEYVTFAGKVMTVYKIIQYAKEDYEGNLVPITVAEYNSIQSNIYLKKARVIVTYPSFYDKPNLVRTEMVSYLSDKGTALSGIKIKGRVQYKDTGGSSAPPGQAAATVVYITGHPEYTVYADNTQSDPQARGYFTIYNVVPGTYYLYASGNGVQTGAYSGNPLIITESTPDVTGIEINCPKKNVATISGTVYDENGVPVNPYNYRTDGRIIWANDGLSWTTTANSSGNYTINNIDPDVGQVTVTAIFTNLSGQTFIASKIQAVSQNGSYIVNLSLTALAGGTGSLNVEVYDADDRITGISGATVILSDVGGNTTYVTTSGSYLYTFAPVSAGNYLLSATKANYKLEGDPKQVAVSTAYNPNQKLYLIKIGSISGIITDEATGNPVPSIPVKVIDNYGSGKLLGEAISNTFNGYYQVDGIPAGADNLVKVELYGTNYTWVSPDKGYYNNVVVTQGVVTTNKNFVIKQQNKPITGNIVIDSSYPVSPDQGILIIAQPTSVTFAPHTYSLDNPVYKAQNNYFRDKYPYYSTIGKGDGTFYISVPMGTNYNLYAYFSYLSFPAKTLVKLYSTVSNVAPNTTNNNFTTWNTY